MHRIIFKHLKRGTLASSLPAALRLLWEIYNAAAYGRSAPRLNETIYVDPKLVRLAIPHPLDMGKRKSAPDYHAEKLNFQASQKLVGRVAEKQIDALRTVPLTELPKIRFCIDHWVNGRPWEETGIYEFLLMKIEELGHAVGDCKDFKDVVRRYERLDQIYFRAKEERCLRSRREISGDSFRETDGIEIHIGKNGELIFGGSGTHRLAMAIALDLPIIPAKLGFVHTNSLPHLIQYRTKMTGGLTRIQPAKAAINRGETERQ